MSCVHKTCSTLTIPAPARLSWNRPRFVAAIVAIVAAFRYAQELRRIAHLHHPFIDE